MQRATTAMTAMLMLAAILIIWNSAAQAGILLTEDAIEVHTRDVYWDGLRAGRLVVRRCADCEARSLSIDASTIYVVRGVGEYDDARLFLKQLRSAEIRNGVAGVYLQRGTDRISRIILLPAQTN